MYLILFWYECRYSFFLFPQNRVRLCFREGGAVWWLGGGILISKLNQVSTERLLKMNFFLSLSLSVSVSLPFFWIGNLFRKNNTYFIWFPRNWNSVRIDGNKWQVSVESRPEYKSIDDIIWKTAALLSLLRVGAVWQEKLSFWSVTVFPQKKVQFWRLFNFFSWSFLKTLNFFPY